GKRTRPIEIRRARHRTEQLSLLQRLHPRMPVQREPGAAESGNASCALAPGRPAAARTNFQQCRFVRQTRLPYAELNESTARFEACARWNGENSWNLRTTLAAPLRQPTLRQMVRETL